MKQTYALILFILIFVLAGCSSTQSVRTSQYIAKAIVNGPIYKGNIKTRLNKHIRSWRGVPYQYGGLNKRGVDCSGYVNITYRDVFGMKVPRSTELLAGIGKEISQHQLKVGDLVFFKTGLRQKHVGIYIGNGQFTHASTSKGVTTSKLNSKYWASHYWKSIRMK